MPESESTSPRAAAPDGRIAGIALLASVAISFVAAGHHPGAGHAHAADEFVRHVVAIAALDGLVHAVLIATAMALLFGVTVFAVRRGLHDSRVLIGLIVYALGAVAVIGAGLVDGFFVPALAAHAAGDPPERLVRAMDLFRVFGDAIQILTKFSLAATAVAMFAWSTELWTSGGAGRGAGIGGFLSALATGLLLVRTPNIGPHDLILILLLQTIWYAWIGVALIRRTL